MYHKNTDTYKCSNCGFEAIGLEMAKATFRLRARGANGIDSWCMECYRGKSKVYEGREPIQVYRKKYQQSVAGKMKSYKNNAKTRGIIWKLSVSEFNSFWQKPCHYCGRPIATIGIDRIDSSLGYEMSNCVACCFICNRMKMETSEEEWYSNMLMVLKHRGILDLQEFWYD